MKLPGAVKAEETPRAHACPIVEWKRGYAGKISMQGRGKWKKAWACALAGPGRPAGERSLGETLHVIHNSHGWEAT